MCEHEQRIIDLEMQGASEEELEAAKWSLIDFRFEGINESHYHVSITEFKRMEAEGECTDRVLLDGEEFRRVLNAGEFNGQNQAENFLITEPRSIEVDTVDLIRSRFENIDFDNLADGEDFLNSLDEGKGNEQKK